MAAAFLDRRDLGVARRARTLRAAAGSRSSRTTGSPRRTSRCLRRRGIQPALEPGEDTEPDALTMIAGPLSEDGVDPWEHGVVEDGEEPEPELAERGGLFRRRRR